MSGIALRKAAGSPALWLAAVAAAALVGAALWARPAPASTVRLPALPVGEHLFNVRDFGAAGDGVTNDTPAINAAIAAANGSGEGTVEFPSGTYLAGASIHMLSNETLRLDAGSTILGASTGYDPPEPNPNSAFQDFGHSHFHDAMIWGDSLTNIGFEGSGTIDGGGHFITGTPHPGQADKIISLTRCTDLTVSGITLKRGGHFAMLINDCNGVKSDNLTISTASDRDGWNVISTQNVRITNLNDSANDDALAFKSDWALGATLPNGNVTVSNSTLSAHCCNALMFGSETCGDFTNYEFSNITITGAGKSGLGMVSMDGAHISNVSYNNITMSGTQSPIMEKIGTRLRCGGQPAVGSISDIHYNNITGTAAGAFSPTLWGQPGHPVSNVTFDNVHLTLPGGRAAMDPNAVPVDNGDYNPNSLGTRPAYGFYMHNVSGITFNNSSVALDANDQRPAFIASAGSSVTFHHVTAQRGTGSPFDVGFQGISAYCITNSHSTTGGVLRLSTPGGSTQGCRARVDNFSLSAAPAAQSVVAGSAATYTVHTAVASGAPDAITLSAANLPPGATASFSPNPVAPGGDATMTVSTTPATPDGTFAVSAVGSDSFATQYAPASLDVTGGLSIGNLSVADPANAAAWSAQSNLQPGAVQFGDRTFVLTSVPPALLGAQWIQTANASKSATANPLVTFTINQPATVAIAVDTRVGPRAWMDASWIDTGTQLGNSESASRSFEVFEKSFPAGPVSLGPDADLANRGSMYTIAVV